MNIQRNKTVLTCTFIAAMMQIGCTSTPEKNQVIDQAESKVQTIRLDANVVEHAPLQLNDAEKDLKKAKDFWRKDKDRENAEHYAYLAERKASTAHWLTDYELAKQEIEKTSEERNDILYQTKSRQLALAKSQTESAKARAESAKEELQALKRKITDLEAQETERGLVLTLSDVLFDLNKAELKPGAINSMQKLAEFLGEYSERKVLIEGFTDSTGEEQYNQQLSERRANAVRDTLMEQGIAANRIRTHGYGESFPVASNKSAAGRQQNRRIEIIVSDQSGEISNRQ